jgi:hypothetical protein
MARTVCAFATQAIARGMTKNPGMPGAVASDKADGRSGSHLAGPQQLHPAEIGASAKASAAAGGSIAHLWR